MFAGGRTNNSLYRIQFQRQAVFVFMVTSLFAYLARKRVETWSVYGAICGADERRQYIVCVQQMPNLRLFLFVIHVEGKG